MHLFRWILILAIFVPGIAFGQSIGAGRSDLSTIDLSLGQKATTLDWSGIVEIGPAGVIAKRGTSSSQAKSITISKVNIPEAALTSVLGTSGSLVDTTTTGRQRIAQSKDPTTPNYDINKAFGSKSLGATSAMPQTMQHVVTVYLPGTPIYHRARKIVFRQTGKDPTFRRAKILGKAEWYYGPSMDYGPAAGLVVKAVLWLNGKPQRRVKTVTDAQGEFRLDLMVNPMAGQAERRFPAFPVMNVKRGKLPPGIQWVVPPDQTPPPAGSGAVQKPKADWKKTIFNALSMYNALKKDFADKKLGGKGTPNFDQWKKNHEAGRESINALSYIIDIASGKATGHAQALDNAFKAYKNLTGKPLPFEKKISKKQASAMKQASRDFWTWIEMNRKLLEN